MSSAAAVEVKPEKQQLGFICSFSLCGYASVCFFMAVQVDSSLKLRATNSHVRVTNAMHDHSRARLFFFHSSSSVRCTRTLSG